MKNSAMALVVSEIPALDDFEAIERFAHANPGWKVEYTESGALVASPTFSDGGARDAEVVGQLRDFAIRAGGKAFGSSTGFRIPGGGLRSPDASWISRERLERLSADQKTKFWNVCPDVVIELLSETDSWLELQDKVRLYFASGAVYAVAIDPHRRDVFTLGAPPACLDLDIAAIVDA